MRNSSLDDEEGGLHSRRNTRSLDMGSSRDVSKAAAWMWHMHNSKTEREEKQADDVAHAIWESKRRSTSCDRKDSRFRQEATSSASATSAASAPASKPAASPSSKAFDASVWDCGSKLYDTFELVSFSNRLDRSLLGVPEFDASNFHHVGQSPLHHSTFAGVLRTFSLPHVLSLHNSKPMTTLPSNDDDNTHVKSSSHDVMNANDANSAADTNHGAPLQDTFGGAAPAIESKVSALLRVLTTKWSLSKLVRILKKVVKFHKQMHCFQPPANGNMNVAKDEVELMGDEEDDGGISASRYLHPRAASSDKNVANELMGYEDDADNGMSERHWYRVYEEKVNEGKVWKHFHHHHHHYHHHFVHHLDQFSQAAKEDNACNLCMSTDWNAMDATWTPARAESARLSSDTLSKICADVNWL